uniref:Acyltransferase n=1 Tax=Panagrolaimus sp. ES5 TaxID=591445 RepID=A0AC34FV70_9BILA
MINAIEESKQSEECMLSKSVVENDLKTAETEFNELINTLLSEKFIREPKNTKFLPEPSKMLWAPLNVPIERRIQTSAVCYFVFVFILAPVFAVIGPLYLLFFTSYWWLVAIYGGWMVYDRNSHVRGAYPKEWFRGQVVWKYFANYFPIKLHKTIDLLPEKNYIIGSHPHGILGISSFANFATEGTGWSQIFPGVKPSLVTLPTQFQFPIRREMVLMTGTISSSSQSIEHVLTQAEKGRAVCVILGGAEEALDSHPDNFDLKLSSRKGFVKLALKTGSDLVPVYNFGETSTFRQMKNSRGTKLREFQSKFKEIAGFSPPLFMGPLKTGSDLVPVYNFGETSTFRQMKNSRGTKLREFQSKFKEIAGFSPPLFMGRGIFNYSFGLLPYRTPINTVVGKPIPVKRNQNPSQEDIDRLHAEYCAQLTILFDENKTKYGIPSDAKLNIY